MTSIPLTNKSALQENNFNVNMRQDSSDKERRLNTTNSLALQKPCRVPDNYQFTIDPSFIKFTWRHKSPITKVEKLLTFWIKEEICRNHTLTSHIIREKALDIHRKVLTVCPSTGPRNFQASRGWFLKFLNKVNLINVTGLRGCDEVPDKRFRNEFIKIVTNGSYRHEQIFNCDECVITWKSLPERTFLSNGNDTNCPRDKITGLFCSNATGDFKCKPLLINNNEDLPNEEITGPRSYHLRTSENSQMTSSIFTDWFEHCFIPEVVKYLRVKSIPFKIILLCDSASYHPSSIAEFYPNIKVVFVPSSNTKSLMPLVRSIATLKYCYFEKLLAYIFDGLKDVWNSVEQCWRGLSLALCADMIVQAWEDMSESTLASSWTGLLPELTQGPKSDVAQSVIEKIIKLARAIGGFGFSDMFEEEVIACVHSNGDSSEIIVGEDEDDENEDNQVEGVFFPSEVASVNTGIKRLNEDQADEEMLETDQPQPDSSRLDTDEDLVEKNIVNDFEIGSSVNDKNRDRYRICTEKTCPHCKMRRYTQLLLNFHFCTITKRKKCTICTDLTWYSSQDPHQMDSVIHLGTGPIVCLFCKDQFKSILSLQLHKCKVSRKSEIFFCSECGANFGESLLLTRHLYKHCGLDLFKCQLCPEAFLLRMKLVRHEVERHKTIGKGALDHENLDSELDDSTDCNLVSSNTTTVIKTEASSDLSADEISIKSEEYEMPIESNYIDIDDPCDADSADCDEPPNPSTNKFYENDTVAVGEEDGVPIWRFWIELEETNLAKKNPSEEPLPYCDRIGCNKCFDYQVAVGMREYHYCPSPNSPKDCYICSHINLFLEHQKLSSDGLLHRRLDSFRCCFCHESFVSVERIKLHKCTISIDDTKLQCRQCGVLRPKGKQYMIHLFYHYNVRAYSCAKCSSRFVSAQRLEVHRRHHITPKKFKCKICDASFIHNREYKRHMFDHGEGKPFKCDNCDKAFAAKYMLIHHQQIHLDKRPYECPHCGRSYVKARTLEMHVYKVHEGSKVSCEICGKKLNDLSSLRTHVALHDRETLHRCHLCYRAYTTPASLKRHVVTHTGEKKHVCPTCGVGFFHLFQLKIHQYTHDKEKPFPCSFCSRTFTQKRQRVAHETKCRLKDCKVNSKS